MSLPEKANLEWLRKEAKRRLETLRQTTPDAKLADAQFNVAKEYGFASWRALKDHIDSLGIDAQLERAARDCNPEKLAALLDQYPGRLDVRNTPYKWTLLHAAAHAPPLRRM